MLTVILILIAIGVVLWAVNTYVPMDAKIKNILNVFVIICVIVWLLNIFSVFAYMSDVGVPRIHK